MRAWLLVIAVLATFQPIVQVASTEDSSSSSSVTSTTTSSTIINKLNRINHEEEEATKTTTTAQPRTKPDPETQVQIEKNLLSLFGMKSRPRSIDRSKVIIPEAMKKLYADITGQEFRTLNIPKPGLHTKSANTVRSFQHEGNCSFSSSSSFFCVPEERVRFENHLTNTPNRLVTDLSIVSRDSINSKVIFFSSSIPTRRPLRCHLVTPAKIFRIYIRSVPRIDMKAHT